MGPIGEVEDDGDRGPSTMIRCSAPEGSDFPLIAENGEGPGVRLRKVDRGVGKP